MTTLSFMLAGSSHARVRARWIIARPCLCPVDHRMPVPAGRPCPVDPHARTSVPARSPHARACWIPTHARLCPLDPRTTVPAGSLHARARWIPMHARVRAHWIPTPARVRAHWIPTHARMHASTRPMHARRMCTHGPHRTRSHGPDARSLVGPPCTHVVSPCSRTPHPSHAYMRLLDVSCMHP